MIEHWRGICGTAWLVALSAAFVGCAPHSYELGKDRTGASGEGGELAGSGGKGGSGTGGPGHKGGTGGGSSGSAGSKGGGKTGGSGGTGASGGSSGVGGSGTISVGDPLLMQLSNQPTKLDLLFMIDNSIGMAQKQAELGNAIPSLIASLSACVDADDNPIGQLGTGGCPPGSRPRLGGLADIHIGIITSSLGDHGSHDVCSDRQNEINVAAGGLASNYNDLALLVPSVRDTDFARAEHGFLHWD
ncbi:MAG TPA: hypothetical protein VFV94_08590, partial [Polyangiaceae bacterium]|nr:hypothetical protein [Polyangiaceae bacterium]